MTDTTTDIERERRRRGDLDAGNCTTHGNPADECPDCTPQQHADRPARQGIIGLRREADTKASSRGHALTWAAPQHGEAGSAQEGYCTCGQHVYIYAGWRERAQGRQYKETLNFPDTRGEPMREPYTRCPANTAQSCGETARLAEDGRE